MTLEDLQAFYQFSVKVNLDVQNLMSRMNQLEEQLKVSKSGECQQCNCKEPK